MPRGWHLATLGFAFLTQISPQPVDTIQTLDPTFSIKSERSWLWGWAWGAESTVSVVDRSPVVSFPSRPAAFGADIRDPILGYVIPLSSFTIPCPSEDAVLSRVPNTGCPNLCIDGPNKPNEAWIALVQRGQCEFVKKVREAQHLGAKAVVVGGADPQISGYPDALVNMYSPEDSSDVRIAATYIKYSDYTRLFSMIESSNTSHSGLRTLSLMITAEYAAWEWYSPIITFIVILLLPSALTFITLLMHRVRAARAARRDRAPENIVRNLPWHVWTGTHWEKHEGGEPIPHSQIPDPNSEGSILPNDTTRNESQDVSEADDSSSSHPKKDPVLRPWFEAQLECAICLSEFVKGDKVRVLPCHHIFHLDEVDEWLIHRKKLCPVCKADVTQAWHPPPRFESHVPTLIDAPDDPYSAEHATERTPLLHSHSESPV